MKRIFPLLLLLFFLAISEGFAQRANGPHPRRITKKTFAHNTESRQGKTEKTRFRRENRKAVLDLNPHSLEKFKTAKANKNYKYKN